MAIKSRVDRMELQAHRLTPSSSRERLALRYSLHNATTEQKRRGAEIRARLIKESQQPDPEWDGLSDTEALKKFLDVCRELEKNR